MSRASNKKESSEPKYESDDILKNGVYNYRQLQKANADLYEQAKDEYITQHGEEAFNKDFANPVPYTYEDLNRYTYEGGENSSLRDSGTPWGESVWDNGSANETEWENLSDVRAENQPWWSQIGSGIVKGAVLAGTTFADGVVGTFAGIGNILAGNTENGVFNAFIDNPFSRKMQEINDAVESILPNYYTQAELEEPWYKNILTANFIGDKFLKNLGFTIGAAYSGKVNAGAMSKLLGMGKLREAFKGAVVTAAGKTLNSSDDIMKAYLTGDAVMDGFKLTEDLAKAAKNMKRADAALKIFGGVTAAMGEGRIEAIQGSNEMYKLRSQQIEDNREKELQEAEMALMQQYPEMFALDENGNPFLFDERGKRLLQSMQDEINEKHDLGLAKLNEDKARAANIIFSLNVPLLAGSNIFQFGRMFSGGYTAGRLANSLAKNEAGKYVVNKTAQRMALAKALSSPLMEAQEEMSQQWIQEIPGAKFGSELNNFFGAKIDPDAEESTINWMKAVGTGFMNSYGSMKQWEQGFIGALTGALGSPRIHLKNAEGKFRPGITNDAELYAGLREYTELKSQAQELVNKLNTSDFKNYYQGLIRHNKFQNDMQAAIERGDRFDYKNAESSQILSDAIMFNKAGRLQDLYDEVESAGKVTLDDVEDIRKSSAKREDGKSIFDDKTDQEVVDFVRTQAAGVKSTLDRYVQVSNDLKTLYGENINDDVLEEMTWMMNQVNDWESRGGSILKTMREALQGKSKELKERFGVDIDVLLNNYNDFTQAFMGEHNLVDKINNIVANKNISVQEQREQINKLLQETSEAVGAEDVKFGREIKHIRKKARDKIAELSRLADAYAEAAQSGGAPQALERIKRQYEAGLAKLQQDFNTFFTDTNKKYNGLPSDTWSKMISNNLIKLQDATIDSEHAKNLRGAITDLENTVYSLLEKQYYIESGKWAEVREAKARARHVEARNNLLAQVAKLSYTLDDRDSQLVDPLNVQKLAEQFNDLIKIVAARTHFIQSYNALAQHPEAFSDAAIKAMNAAAEQMETKESNKLSSSIIEKVKSIDDLKEAIKNNSSNIINKAFNEINDSEGNDELKKIIKDYNDIQDLSESFNTWYAKSEKTPAVMTARNVIEDALNKASTQKEAFKIIKAFLDSDLMPEVKTAVKEFYEEFKENAESKKATKKDDSAPEKSIKKGTKGKRKSALSGLSDDDDTSDDDPDEDGGEEDDEKKPPKTKGAKKRRYGALGGLFAEEEEMPKPEDAEPEDDGTEPDLTSDNISEFLESLDDEQLKEISDGKYVSMDVMAEALGITVHDDINDDDTFNTIKEEAKEIIDARAKETTKEAEERKKAAEEAKKKKEEEKAKKEEERKAKKAAKEEEAKKKAEKKGVKEITLSDEDGEPLDSTDLVNFVEDVLPEIDDDVLEMLATGKYIISNIDSDLSTSILASTLKSLATKELERRKSPKVHTESDDKESVDDDYYDNDNYSGEDALPSWAATQYLIDPLKDIDTRRAVVNDTPLVRALQQLGAYEFVDNGSLGTLYNNDHEIPIHFIFSLDNDVLSDTPLLAIEITDEVEDLVTPINPIEINGKMYQVVGSLGFHKKSNTSTKTYGFLRARLDEEFSEDKSNKKGYWVSKNIHSQIRHLYSGRMVKSDAKNDVEERPLKDVLKGEEPHFGIYYSEGDFRTPTIDKESESVVALNENNSNPREGSFWLMTKEADGRYYAKYLNIVRFDEYELSKHSDSPIIEELIDNLKVLVDPSKSVHERLLARDAIEDILYFPEGSKIHFDEDSGVVSIDNFEDDITEGEDIDDDVEALLDALQSPDLSLRFNIKPSQLIEPTYVENLLNSDIIKTDLLYTHNVNASFDIYPVDINGNPIIDDDFIATGHTGKRGINNSLSHDTVYHNNSKYFIDSDSNITDEDGDEVTDQDTIDEILFIQSIKSGKETPLEGTNMYEGYYSDSEPFGVVNNKVVSKEKYEQLKAKSRKAKKKRLASETLDDITKDKKKKSSKPEPESQIDDDDWVPRGSEDSTDEGDENDDGPDWVPRGSEDDNSGYDEEGDDRDWVPKGSEDDRDWGSAVGEDDPDNDDDWEARVIKDYKDLMAEVSEEDRDWAARVSPFGRDNDDDWVPRGSEDDDSFNNESNEEPESNPTRSSGKKKADSSEPTDVVMDDTTLGRKANTEVPANFQTLVRSKALRGPLMQALQNNEVSDIGGLVDIINKYPSKFPAIESIDTQEKMESVLDTLANKCYLR